MGEIFRLIWMKGKLDGKEKSDRAQSNKVKG